MNNISLLSRKKQACTNQKGNVDIFLGGIRGGGGATPRSLELSLGGWGEVTSTSRRSGQGFDLRIWPFARRRPQGRRHFPSTQAHVRNPITSFFTAAAPPTPSTSAPFYIPSPPPPVCHPWCKSHLCTPEKSLLFFSRKGGGWWGVRKGGGRAGLGESHGASGFKQRSPSLWGSSLNWAC